MNRIKPTWEKHDNEDKIWKLYWKLITKTKLRQSLEMYQKEIIDESCDLGAFLFSNGKISENNLNKLLKTRTDRATLEKEKLFFRLNPDKDLFFQLNPEKKWYYVKKAFDYGKFSRFEGFKELIALLNVETCPYCNRSFTSTVEITENVYHRQNQADHYMNKNEYPYLALTLPNLIPVCANCNLHKSDNGVDVLYPYKEGFDDNYRFITHPVSGYGYLAGQPESTDEFIVKIEEVHKSDSSQEYSEYKKRAENAISRLGLDVLYTTHNDYVTQIFRQRYIFGDAYIEDIVNSFPGLFKDKADVRHMLYMKSIAEEDLGKAPLSRLTRDIDNEIDGLLSMND